MSFDMFADYPLSWKPSRKALKRPFAKSLVEQMVKDINNGNLLPGTKLPPQRELAYFLNVSFTTITRAYKLSQQQGLTYGIVGNGTYISQGVNTSTTITTDKMDNIHELGFMASFESSNKLIKQTVAKVANQKGILSLLNYEEPTGIAKHKIIATKYLSEIGMNSNQQNTFITSGGSNALTITLMELFKSGDKIVVDQFTYANFIELARLRGVEMIPIASDSEGMRTDLLAQACKNNDINGIYLMPDCNNPTTQSISVNRRNELAKIIKNEKLILIEDDYFNFLNLVTYNPLNKMSNLVPEQSIYICSMSKTLSSGLRIAFMRVADQFKEPVETAIFTINAKTSSLNAEIVTKSLENGTANKIIKYRLQQAKRANEIFDNIFYPNAKKHFKINFFRWLPLSSSLNGSYVEQICMNKHIRVFHSDRFLVGSQHKNSFLRVSLSSIDDLNELETTLNGLKSTLLKNKLI